MSGPTPPPISWCRIFQVGPPCGRLCEDCQATVNSMTRDDRRALVVRSDGGEATA